jgi:hypothetical protein
VYGKTMLSARIPRDLSGDFEGKWAEELWAEK